MKQSKIDYYLGVAETVAKASPDPNTQVGCVLVKPTGEIISTGFNGFIRKATVEGLPLTKPEKYEFMIHAEHNVILNAARNGQSTVGSYAFVTHSPCKDCCRYMIQAGIELVYYKYEHCSLLETFQAKDLNLYPEKPHCIKLGVR